MNKGNLIKSMEIGGETYEGEEEVERVTVQRGSRVGGNLGWVGWERW